jgi:uncharacterized protein
MPPDRPQYTERSYRDRMEAADLVGFRVQIRETDLQILAQRDLTEEAARAARRARRTIEAWIETQPEFARSLKPVPCPVDAPPIVRSMCAAAEAAEVGPMASVAGAIAEYVARELEPLSPEVIVENGGDTFLMGRRERTALILAGDSPLSNRLALAIPPERLPLSVCTSSATVGPSLSLGKADAAVIAAESGALADAVASAVGNRVHTPGDLPAAVEHGSRIAGVVHVVAIMGDRMAAWGELALRRLGP